MRASHARASVNARRETTGEEAMMFKISPIGKIVLPLLGSWYLARLLRRL
jgi:hypothetical protein